MASETKQDLLKRIPPITELLKEPAVADWLKTQPLPLVTDCLRGATAAVREGILADADGRCGPEQVTAAAVLARAAGLLARGDHAAFARGDQRHGHHPAHGAGAGGVSRRRGGFDAAGAEGLFDAGRGSRNRRAD